MILDTSINKIVLVDPPWYKLVGSHYNSIPLGICYISSYLRSQGYNCTVYNADYKDDRSFLTQYERLQKYEDYINILKNESHSFWGSYISDIINMKPDVVGFSICQPTLKVALIMAKLLKLEEPNIKIIFGGPQITLNPIKYDNVDHIVTGEGEYGILECFKKNSPYLIKADIIENLDSLPFPDRDALYFKGKYLEYGHIITGRGCPFKCIFCASSIIWENRFRLRSIENVIKEVSYIKDKYGCKEFCFRDDTFTITKKRTIDMCKELKKLDIEWECDTRIDNLSYDILKLMKESGCKYIRIGIESGNERVLKLINKQITKEKARQVVSDAKKLGIKVITYFMTGIPTETKEEVLDSLNFAKELDPDDIGLSLATPYFGTKMKEMMKYNDSEIEKYFHQSPDLIKRTKNKDIIQKFYEYATDKRKHRPKWGNES